MQSNTDNNDPLWLKHTAYKSVLLLLLLLKSSLLLGDRGGTVVKVLCYKSEGRWFDPSWCHWNFSLI